MENIFKDSNTVITPALDDFYSNSFLVQGNPANENVMPTPQIGDFDDKTKEVKAAINKLNNISDLAKNNVTNIQSKYTDPLADAKMFTFNPTYKGLNWDRYKNHSSFDKLGFDPFRDNEKFYNENSSIWSDFTRGVQGFGKITAGAFINTAADLPKLLTGDWAPNTEAAKDTERIMAETMSTRGTFGSSVINFGINAGFTVGIIGELFVEEALLAAVGLGGAFETGGASLGAAGYLAAVRAGMAGSKIMGLGKTTGALLKTIKNLDNAVEAKKYFTQFGRGAAGFLNPLESTTNLIRNFDNLKGLTQVAQASRSFGAFFKDIRDINRSFSEAKLEGGFVQNAMFEKLLSEAYANGKTPTPEEIDKIKEVSLTAGYVNQMINFPVIQYTNNIAFGGLTRPLNRLIGATEDSVRMLNKTVTADITRKQIFQELAGGWRESFKRGLNPRLMTRNTLNYFSANLAEGLQESFQEASSIAMEDYYTKKYHNENSIVRNQYELSMLDSYGKGIGAQFSGQGLETFLSGFLMGGLMKRGGKLVKGSIQGIGTGINESSNKIKDLFYSYAKPDQLQDIRDKREARKIAKEEQIKKYDQFRTELINNLNDFYSDSGKMLTRDLAHMSAQEILDARAKQAQETGDKKFLIDFTDTSLYENVQNALYFGKFDLYIEHLNKIKSLDDQGLMEALGIEDAEAGRQRLEVAIERANNIKQRSEKFAKNPFNFNDYEKDTEEYNEMQYMHHAYEDAKNAAIFTPYQFDRVLSRMSSITNDFASIDLVANGNANEFLHLFGLENIVNEEALLKTEVASLKDGTKENERLAKRKEKQIEDLAELRNRILEYKKYFNELKENEEVDPQYEKNLKNTFIKYLGTHGENKSRILKSDRLDDAFQLFNDYYRLNIDAEYLSRSVAVVADPDFLRRDSLRRYETIKKLHLNRKQNIERKVDVYLKKIGLNGVFQNLYDAGYVGEPEEMVAYNISAGKKRVTTFYRTKDHSRVTSADAEDIAKINKIFKDYEDITGITKEKEEAAKKAEIAAAKKAEEEAEAARVAEKAKALDIYTPETKIKLLADYEDYELKDQESFEEYLSSPRAARIIAEEKQPILTPTPAPAPYSGYGIIAADYLFTDGPGVMLSTDFFIQALSGAFINAGGLIEEIRQKYIAQIGDLGNLKDVEETDNYKNMIAEIRDAINNTYNNNSEIQDIFNIILENSSGFSTTLGRETSLKLEKLNEELSKEKETPVTPLETKLEKKEKEISIIEPEALKNVKNTTKALEELKAKTGKSVALEIVNLPKYGIKDDYPDRSSEEVLSLVYHKAKIGMPSWSSLSEEDTVREDLIKVVEDLLTSTIVKPEVTSTPTTSTSDLEKRRNALPDYQGNTRSPATQVILDYFAEVVGIPKWNKGFESGKYAKWLDNHDNGNTSSTETSTQLGYRLRYLLNTPKAAFDAITKYKEELDALEEKPKTTTESQVDTERRSEAYALSLKSTVVDADTEEYITSAYHIPFKDEGNTGYTVIRTDTKEEIPAKLKEFYDNFYINEIKERRKRNIEDPKIESTKDDYGNSIGGPYTGLYENEKNKFIKITGNTVQEVIDKINAEYDKELAGLESKPETKKEEPKVKEPFPLSPQFEGKIIYFSPGLGKTTLVNQYPDQFVDMDVLLYEEFKDEPGFENATPETFGSVISDVYKKVKYNQEAFDKFDSIKNVHYNNAFKKAKALANQGKTVLTGSGAFISRADFSIKATDEKISREQLKNKKPTIELLDLSEALSSIRRNENRNNVLMSVDKDSFTQFLMGNYDILKYINQDITFEQLDELGKFMIAPIPQEVMDAFSKKMEYLQSRILIFTNLQPGDTVIILNEKTNEQIKTKIMKKRNPDSYDLEITPGLEINSLNRNRLNTLINVIPAQGVSKGIKIDDVDNSDAKNNVEKMNASFSEEEFAKLDETMNESNDDDMINGSEDPNLCNV